MGDDHRRAIQAEFERAASAFAERTEGRFDDLDVVSFSRAAAHERAIEVGAGTGNFLALFEGAVAQRVAFDLTRGMLEQARARHSGLDLVQGDAHRLPFRSRSFDLVMSAQALHHIHDPVPVLREMRRITADGGRVLIVDQHSTESYEQNAFMTQLEAIRDPSHAVSRPPSAFRVVVQAAGLRIADMRLWEGRNTLSQWMWPGEFPESRIEKVRSFIESFGHETGMEWRREGDDWTFTRRRVMLLATR